MNYRRRQEASEYLLSRWKISVSPSTLAKLACNGGGPTFQRSGRWPLYREDWLDEWAQGRLSPPVRSTAELPKKAIKASTVHQEAA